jgi:hypothetical protein
MSNPYHRLRPLPAAPLVVRRRYLFEVPSPLLAVPLVVRRKLPWLLRSCSLRVFNRGAQADARPAVRLRVDNRARVTYAAATPAVRKVSGARQNSLTIADNPKAFGQLFARLAG